jgi:transposase
MRKQINGLATLVEQVLEQDLFSHTVFVFCNRDRRIVKCLYWDRTGFAMWIKRLEKHRFPWPRDSHAASLKVTEQQLGQLLSGIDFWRAHEQLHYTKVS